MKQGTNHNSVTEGYKMKIAIHVEMITTANKLIRDGVFIDELSQEPFRYASVFGWGMCLAMQDNTIYPIQSFLVNLTEVKG